MHTTEYPAQLVLTQQRKVNVEITLRQAQPNATEYAPPEYVIVVGGERDDQRITLTPAEASYLRSLLNAQGTLF